MNQSGPCRLLHHLLTSVRKKQCTVHHSYQFNFPFFVFLLACFLDYVHTVILQICFYGLLCIFGFNQKKNLISTVLSRIYFHWCCWKYIWKEHNRQNSKRKKRVGGCMTCKFGQGERKQTSRHSTEYFFFSIWFHKKIWQINSTLSSKVSFFSKFGSRIWIWIYINPPFY